MTRFTHGHPARTAALILGAWSAIPCAGPAGARADDAGGQPPHLRISSRFGERVDPLDGRVTVHAGIDLPGRSGSPVLAAASATVDFAGWRRGYGNLVELDHRDGTRTRYGHLSSILVRTGDAVVQGQQIGRMGSTGRSTGSHLHFEYRRNGRAVDPLAYLSGPLHSARLSRLPAPSGREFALSWRPPAPVHRSAFASAMQQAGPASSTLLPSGDTVAAAMRTP